MRPQAVTATTWLMAILNALGLAFMADPAPGPFELAVRFVNLAVFVTAGYVVLWFYWRGHNWARWLVMITCPLCFWNLTGLPHVNVVAQFMIIAEALVAVFLLWWLNTVTARGFFVKRRSQHAGTTPLVTG